MMNIDVSRWKERMENEWCRIDAKKDWKKLGYPEWFVWQTACVEVVTSTAIEVIAGDLRR